MRRSLTFISLLLLLAPAAHGAELQVHAAASLTDALTEIGTIYRQRTGTRVRFNFAGSSTLAWQIEEHAPGDVFISADEARMNELARRDLIVAATRRPLLSNTLVVVVPDDSRLTIRSPGDLVRPEVRRIAVGHPESVPAGVYTRQFLTAAGLWSRVLPKLIPTENVRAALAAVEEGNVDAAFVYRTDALAARHARVAFAIEGRLAPAISYPVAVLSESPQKAEARRFVEFLRSADARRVFVRRGFAVR